MVSLSDDVRVSFTELDTSYELVEEIEIYSESPANSKPYSSDTVTEDPIVSVLC